MLDCEGVSKAAAGDRDLLETLAQARKGQYDLVVSAATLAETLRGYQRDAGVHRILRLAKVEALTPELGKSAGHLLGRSGLPSRCTVDAMVAATALVQKRPAVIITSDPKDLAALIEGEEGVGVFVV